MSLYTKIINFFTEDKVKEIEEKVKNNVSDYKVENPYVKLINKTIFDVSTGNVSVILMNGDVFNGIITQDQYESLTNCNDKKCLLEILSPKKENIKGIVDSIIKSTINIFKNNPDFDIIGDKVYLKSIKSVKIPPVIVAEFIRILDTKMTQEVNRNVLDKEYQSLLMFTYWLLLNPIESSREDCLTFIKKNDITLTENGLMKCYRKVVSKNKTNNKLVKFISESYYKIKKQKKNTANYWISQDEDTKEYILSTKKFTINSDLGNLKEMYQNLHLLQEKSYTDNYTETKDIKIGAIYKEDENNISLDNTKACDKGLHCGSAAFSYSSFGDTGVLALVNPMYVRSVPVVDAHKMRVSEMFICTTMEKDDYDNEKDILDYSEEYCGETLEILKENLKNKSFSNLSCQDNLPNLTIKEVLNISELLSKRVVLI